MCKAQGSSRLAQQLWSNKTSMQNTVSYDSSVKAKPLLKAMPEEFYPVDLTEELKTLASFRALRGTADGIESVVGTPLMFFLKLCTSAKSFKSG